MPFIGEFPFAKYSIRHTKNGSFYIDDIRDVIKDMIRKGRSWEGHINRLIRKYTKPGMIAIDIGAHIGTHAVAMSQCIGTHGMVICFEPQKKLYREFIMNIILNKCTNVIAYRYALGDKESLVHMQSAVPGNEGGTPIGIGGDEVFMKTLDSFQLENVSIIKIDVEGYEDNVLQGAYQTIMTNRPVMIIEIMGGNDYDTASPQIREKIDGTKKILQAYGYSVTKLGVHDYLAIPL